MGKDAVKFAVLHLDETTPHIHILVTPEQEKEVTVKNKHGVYKKLSMCSTLRDGTLHSIKS